MAKAKGNAIEDSGEDQSMEEILQSIRKIIAEENDDPTPDEAPVEAEKPKPAAAPAPVAEEALDEEEVLELTDAIQDDGSVVNVGSDNDDVLANIDDALEDDDAFGAEDDDVMEASAPVKKAAPKARPAQNYADDGDEGLLSAASLAASAEALRALKAPQGMGGMQFLSGNTVEGLVQMMLRPMLKEWLDTHMPAIVQQAVERELKRIASNLDE